MIDYYVRVNYLTDEGHLSLVGFIFFGHFYDGSQAFEAYAESEYSSCEDCSLLTSGEVATYMESHDNYIFEG